MCALFVLQRSKGEILMDTRHLFGREVINIDEVALTDENIINK